MATTRITPDNDAVVAEIFIAAPPERVFEAISNSQQALQWGSSPEFQVTEWEMDARPGGKWHFVSVETKQKGKFEHHGEVLEVDPPRLLVYTWFANWHETPSHKTVVRWELSRASGGTRLKVTHSGLAQLPAARKGYSEGWPGLLQRIKEFVER